MKAEGSRRDFSESRGAVESLLHSFGTAAYPRGVSFSRARDYHLYTPRGERYLDCILAGGAAILGHNPPGLARAIKNRISSGPGVPVTSREDSRLRQAVRRLFPAVVAVEVVDFRRCAAPGGRGAGPAHTGSSAAPTPAGPAHTGSSAAPTHAGPARLPLWRPFAREVPQIRPRRSPEEIADLPWPQPPAPEFLLLPSFPVAPELAVQCRTDRAAPGGGAEESDGLGGGAEESGGPGGGAEESGGPGSGAAGITAPGSTAASPAGGEIVSPVLVAGLAKAVHLLASAYEGQPVPRKLTSTETDGWKDPLWTGDLWERCGVYYGYVGPVERYETLRNSLAEGGILIPEDTGSPVVCPRIVGGRERSLWERICSTI